MLKVCIDDAETLQVLGLAAADFARGTVPRNAMHCFTMATLTALQKKDGGVRGIATGTTFRRLVAKSVAKQFSKDVEAACAPFQFALSTRAGVDCVGHAVRSITEMDQHATLLSIDGVGAYDHVFRSSILKKLKEVPALQPMLPLVRAVYSQPSRYWWQDESGHRHEIQQHEGGEQGDPLMPLLFSLAIHNALEEAKREMVDGEELLAFLDDIYILCSPGRTRFLYNVIREKLLNMAGIQLHTGKTRCWNSAGVCPPGIGDLGQDVWSPRGVKVLGTPVGSEEFVREISDLRLEEEQKLWDAIPWIPDLQCGWQVLLQCAGPRCHHFLQTMPPSASLDYAQRHDTGMLGTMESLLGSVPGTQPQKATAHMLATLPMRMGGLGLRSAVRTAPAAFWASWADALPMIATRLPVAAAHIVHSLTREEGSEGCVGELQEAASRLDREGFVMRPDWTALRDGARPPVVMSAEPGEWQHGWQYHASSASEHNFRETMVLSSACPSDQAHLRSHSGPGSSGILLGAPTGPEFSVLPEHFRTLVLERLRLPLDVVEARCECGTALDTFGRHRAACPHSGRLKRRAVAPERTLARICREAGATVRCNARLRDMNVAVSSTDDRAIEVLASGLPYHHGAQLAVDITLRSVLTRCGNACNQADRVDGVVLARARLEKERKYAELLHGDRCHLVVVGIETGGRWSPEALHFVDTLAATRAREAPPTLRRSAYLAWVRRWPRMLAVSCGRSFAHSLISPPAVDLQGTDGPLPDLADLFQDCLAQ